MIIPYYKALENPHRTLNLKLNKEETEYWSNKKKQHYDDWIEDFKYIENELDYLYEDEREEYLSKKIVLPENDLSYRNQIPNIIPVSQLNKMSPAKRNAAIKVLNQLANPLSPNDRILKLELLASYISPTGEMIDVTSDHQKIIFANLTVKVYIY